MSYILDALKKADAARERESVPGLHSRHDAPLPGSDHGDDEAEPKAGSGRGSRVLQGAAAGMVGGAVLAAALAGWWKPDDEARPPVATSPPPAEAPVHAQQAPAASPPPLPTPVPTLPPAPAPAPAPPSTQPPAPREAPERKAIAQAPLRVDPSLKDTPPRVVSYQELPEDIKRELPQLNVGGAMHSEVAANRMLILNGGLFREGEQPAPGLVLEEIKLKSATFRYKGHRYSVAY